MAPDAPNGWPTAMAPPLTLVLSMSAPLSFCHDQGHARNLQPRLLQHCCGAWNGSFKHQHGVGAHHCLRANARAWLQAELLGLLQRHEEDGSGAVGDLARVAGRDRVLWIERGLKCRGRLVARVRTNPFVLVDELVVAVAINRNLERHDLRLEVALVCGCVSELVAAYTELVHRLAGDSVLSRHQLGRDALRNEVIDLRQLWRKR